MHASKTFYGPDDPAVAMPETSLLDPCGLLHTSALCEAQGGDVIAFVHPQAPQPEGIFRGKVLGYWGFAGRGITMCIELADGYAELDMRSQKDFIISISREETLLWTETL